MHTRWLTICLGIAIGGSPLSGAEAQETGTPDAASENPRAVSISLESDLPQELLGQVPDPVVLPERDRLKFYGRTLGSVFAHLRQPEDRPAFVEWIREHTSEAASAPVDPEQLRKDAARLARVRLRRTAGERKASRAPFVALGDMLAHPEFYQGRPFTVWGHARRPVAVHAAAAGEDGAALYELHLEPLSAPERTVIALLAQLPEGFAAEGDQTQAVTVTGYFFRAQRDAGEGNGSAFTPLLVAASLTWHQAELSPGTRDALAAAVQHRTPHRREEVDYFYRLLRHAELVKLTRQKEAARAFRRVRIEQFPRDSRADLEHRLRQIAAARQTNPQDAAALKRREEQARSIFSHERRLYSRFHNDPEQFPTFAHVFRSAESSDPHRYTGRPVTLAGHIRKHVSYPADPENEHGVAWLHEIWLYPDDGGSNPVVVMCPSAPPGLPQGENLLERGAVTGYFYKLWAYPARDTNRVAPMILAQRVEWLPAAAAAEPGRWLIALVWSAGGLLALATIFAAWRLTRRGRRLPERYAGTLREEPPDFSQL